MEATVKTREKNVNQTDNRLKFLNAALKKNLYQQDALIEVLHTAQELFGYLSKETLEYITKELKLPPSKVYGVATFYNFFSLKPKGEHTCIVCMGTACYVKGAAELLSEMEKYLNIKAGETTKDGKISVATARCIGTCGSAPAIIFDNQVAAFQTKESVINKLKEWL
jgi:bidirectional [NiFe] hydrogenase diaphorase subunit